MASLTQSLASRGARLAIGPRSYDVETIDGGEDYLAAFRLTRDEPDPETGLPVIYDVVRSADGLILCDCPAFEYRHRQLTAEPCKHGRALLAAGYFAADAPAEAWWERVEDDRRDEADVEAAALAEALAEAAEWARLRERGPDPHECHGAGILWGHPACEDEA